MLNQNGGSRTDTLIKLVLVFFLSLLSFSVGTFVGKQFSDSQHKIAALENGEDADRNTASIPADATLEGVGKLTDITVGDSVDIDYVAKNGQRVASMVSVDKGTEEADEEIPADETETVSQPAEAQPQ